MKDWKILIKSSKKIDNNVQKGINKKEIWWNSLKMDDSSELMEVNFTNNNQKTSSLDKKQCCTDNTSQNFIEISQVFMKKLLMLHLTNKTCSPWNRI